MTYYAILRHVLVHGEEPGAWRALGEDLERAKAEVEGPAGEQDEVLVEDIVPGAVWDAGRGSFGGRCEKTRPSSA